MSGTSNEWIKERGIPTLGLNPKQTSWDLLCPVAYKSYQCVSLRNRLPLKLYVFLKNIILHSIMCEISWTVIRTQFYRLLSEKVHKDPNGPFRPGAIIVLHSNDITSLLASVLNKYSTLSWPHSSSRRKGHSLQGYTGWMTEIQWKIARSKRPVSVIHASFVRRWWKSAFNFDMNKN